MRIRLEVAWDGSEFGGWQKQPSGTLTIQEIFERVISQIYNEKISVTASGRTDRGVHAYSQTLSFTVNKPSPAPDLVHAINSMTPRSITVKNAWEAPLEFHVQKSVRAKTYIYRVYNAPRPHAIMNRYSHWVRQPLNLDRLQAMAELLKGRHDFVSFQNQGANTLTTTRTIYKSLWRKVNDEGLIEYRVTGSGFLKQMVRNLVGTMLDIEIRGEPPETLQEIIQAKKRAAARVTAPANGLFLWRVYYTRDLDIKCRKL